MHQIEIDEVVYAHLEKHVKGFEKPNDVLRRLLLDAPPGDDSNSKSHTVKGSLYGLIEKGLIAEGDSLIHTKVRSARSFTGTITAGGCIETEMGVYKKPSPALAKLLGSQINGWIAWVHAPSGKTLHQLTEEAEQADKASNLG